MMSVRYPLALFWLLVLLLLRLRARDTMCTRVTWHPGEVGCACVVGWVLAAPSRGGG